MALFGTNPLSRHRLFETTDPREARTRVSELICPHALYLGGEARKVDLCWHRVGLRSVEFHSFHYGVATRIETVIRSSFLVEIPLHGSGTTRHGDSNVESHPGRAIVLSPGSLLRAEFSSDCTKLLVLIPEFAVRQQLKGMLGTVCGEAVRFDPTIDLDRGAGASLHRMIEFILGEVDSLSPPQLAWCGLQFEQMLLQTLLVSHQNSYSRAIEACFPESEPPCVRAAEHYMRSHLEEIRTIADLAAGCGVSERTLQEGFRRHRGISVTAALRELRLSCAHEALMGTRPGTTTVAAIATACGFDELGRFAVEYRRRYSETPSATMRRATAPARKR